MFDRPFRLPAYDTTRERVRHEAEDAGQAGHKWVDNTRQFAAEALGRATSRMRNLGEGVVDRSSAAQRHMGQYAQSTGRYMADRPLRSALFAAAAGAALAAYLLALRHRARGDGGHL
jgi:ElaB/YqjD/DUF883 family membrane-anchored ribosome-binding protein